jgi:uncharacterized protein
VGARTLVDNGPIVATLVGSDAYHRWTIDQLAGLEPPLYTCEAVLSEAQFLIQRFRGNPLAVLEFVDRGKSARSRGFENPPKARQLTFAPTLLTTSAK